MPSHQRRTGLVGPLLLIGLGVLFLLENMGLLALSVWDITLRLWPLVLIAWGLELLLGRRSAWGAALALILTLAILVSGVFMLGDTSPPSLSTIEIDYSSGGAHEADVILDPAVAYLKIRPAENMTGELLRGEVAPIRGERIEKIFTPGEHRPEAVIRTSSVIMLPFLRLPGDRASWDIFLNPTTTYGLQVDVGAGKTDLFMAGLRADRLEVHTGIGQTIVHLPGQGEYMAVVSGGLGQIVLYLPHDLGVKLDADVGIGALNIPSGFRREGDAYLSSNYPQAEEMIELEVKLGIGSIQIR
jgi:predicted membrane protein